MEAWWAWIAIAIFLIIIEMLTFTVYLLAGSAAAIAAGVVSYYGVGWVGQFLVAVLVCIAGIMEVMRRTKSLPSEQVNFTHDLGATVTIVKWSDHSDKEARVLYQGTEWDAELAPNTIPNLHKASWNIKAIVGTKLVIG